MSGVVVDAPVALTWCFPDEAREYADGVLVALKGQALVVPAVWGLEIANALLTGERRKRLKQPEILRFVASLEGLSILQDGQAVGSADLRLLQVCGFSRFTAGKAADFEMHEVCATRFRPYDSRSGRCWAVREFPTSPPCQPDRPHERPSPRIPLTYHIDIP